MNRLDHKIKEIPFDPAVMDAVFVAPAPDEDRERRKREREEEVRQRMARVRRAMRAGLTLRQRECLTLYYLKGYDQWEIGRRLGIHQTTVSEHIQRALEKLRRVLKAQSAEGSMPVISLDRGWEGG